MNKRYSCVNPCKNWGIPCASCPACTPCPCSDKIRPRDIQHLGPTKTCCCDCAYQGSSARNIPNYGYYKPIPLPYVNYGCNEQRSPYDN